MRRVVRDRTVLSLGRILTNPALAFVVYNAVFLGWHFPAAYDLALNNHSVHVVQHLMFISVAVMMWWPVVAPVPELERIPDGPLLMLYVFAFGIPMTILSAFLTMSDRLIYPYYELAPRVTSLGPLEDQRLGGLLMWIPGMLIFWVAITAILVPVDPGGVPRVAARGRGVGRPPVTGAIGPTILGISWFMSRTFSGLPCL